jgi:hypothetical protein
MEIQMDFEFPSPDNTNVVCIEVDNEELALSNQAPYSEWIIYTGPYALYRYSENCALSTPKSQVYRDIYVYPNPASNVLHIGNRLANATANVILYDMSGRLVLHQGVKNDDNIDISRMGKGVYMVIIDMVQYGQAIKS